MALVSTYQMSTELPSSRLHDPVVGPIIAKLRHQLKDKRVLYKPFVMDFDRTRCGHVTKQQLFRSLTMIDLTLSKDEFEALGDAYTTARFPDRVHYRALLADLDEENNGSGARADGVGSRSLGGTLSALKKPPPPKPVDPDLNHDGVLRKIRKTAIKNRLMVDGIFADFDKLRKGRVNANEFVRAISGIAGLHLTQAELDVLVDPYRCEDDPDYVRYKLFEDACNAVYVDPDVATRSVAFESKLASDQDMHDLYALLDRIAYVSYTRRILIKPQFASLDHAKHGRVTARQFRSVVSSYPLTFTERDWTLLLTNYDRGAEGVSYVDFCADIAKGEEALAQQSLLSTSVREEKALSRSIKLPEVRVLTIDDVIIRLRGEVERLRLDTSDMFNDFDPLKKGFVTATQFRRALSAYQLELSDEEFQLLRETFSIQPDRMDYLGFSNSLHPLPNTRFGLSRPLQEDE